MINNLVLIWKIFSLMFGPFSVTILTLSSITVRIANKKKIKKK